MKKTLVLVCLGAIFALFLSACNAPTNNAPVVDTPPEEPANSSADAPENPPTDAPIEAPEINLAGPDIGTTMLWVDDSILVFVPGGDFLMGATYDNPQDHPEHPEHLITQSGFWIYRSEVTNGMYANCVANGSCTPPATDIQTDYADPNKFDHPIVAVGWQQAQDYCNWADGHLPTEAQWEKTARGTNANLYPWGESQPICDLLNFDNCVGEILPSGAYWSTTTPIRKYFSGASFYEALDMEGNVFEWVQDWFKLDYYVESPNIDPPGPENGEVKVVRSSGFRSIASFVPSARRDFFPPNEYRDDLGFRCVIEAPPYYPPACVYTSRPPERQDCPPPQLKVNDTYCKRDIGYAEFSVTEGATVNSSACSEISPNTYRCVGAEGGFVNVEVCLDCAPEACNSELIQCAHPYILNKESCQCELAIRRSEAFEGLEQASPEGELETLGELRDGYRCPPGYYYDFEAHMCVPAEDPNDCFDPAMLMAVVPAECDDCPPGMHYNEEIGCCEPDERATLEPATATSCENFTLQLGTCGGSSQTSCTRPEQYGTQIACANAGCRWEPSLASVGGGSCKLP